MPIVHLINQFSPESFSNSELVYDFFFSKSIRNHFSFSLSRFISFILSRIIFRFCAKNHFLFFSYESFSISDSFIDFVIRFCARNHFSFIVISHAMIYYCASNHYSNTYVAHYIRSTLVSPSPIAVISYISLVWFIIVMTIIYRSLATLTLCSL